MCCAYPLEAPCWRKELYLELSLPQKSLFFSWCSSDRNIFSPRLALFPACVIIAPNKRGIQIYIFLISPQKHMLWYSLEAPRWGASNEYPQHMFSWRKKENTKKKIVWKKKKKCYLELYGLTIHLCSYIIYHIFCLFSRIINGMFFLEITIFTLSIGTDRPVLKTVLFDEKTAYTAHKKCLFFFFSIWQKYF